MGSVTAGPPISEQVVLDVEGDAFKSLFFFSNRRRHTRSLCDWSSDVCSSDLGGPNRFPIDCVEYDGQHDRTPIVNRGRFEPNSVSGRLRGARKMVSSEASRGATAGEPMRSEEHTSELQSHSDLVCRLLLEKKN